MRLSDRLETILEMLGSGNKVLADIGTDHGFTAIEAMRRGQALRAIACDIANGPIAAARQHISDVGLSQVIDARVADGLAGLAPGEADAIIISGMGGGLICRIIEEGAGKLTESTRMILSPQSELFDFRKWILEHGFDITAEKCLVDDGKFYNVIEVTKGRAAKVYSGQELAYGRRELFDEKSSGIRDEYIGREILVLTDIYERLKAMPGSHESRLSEIEEKIKLAEAGLL